MMGGRGGVVDINKVKKIVRLVLKMFTSMDNESLLKSISMQD